MHDHQTRRSCDASTPKGHCSGVSKSARNFGSSPGDNSGVAIEAPVDCQLPHGFRVYIRRQRCGSNQIWPNFWFMRQKFRYYLSGRNSNSSPMSQISILARVCPIWYLWIVAIHSNLRRITQGNRTSLQITSNLKQEVIDTVHRLIVFVGSHTRLGKPETRTCLNLALRLCQGFQKLLGQALLFLVSNKFSFSTRREKSTSRHNG